MIAGETIEINWVRKLKLPWLWKSVSFTLNSSKSRSFFNKCFPFKLFLHWWLSRYKVKMVELLLHIDTLFFFVSVVDGEVVKVFEEEGKRQRVMNGFPFEKSI
jgi:hypothetical protein